MDAAEQILKGLVSEPAAPIAAKACTREKDVFHGSASMTCLVNSIASIEICFSSTGEEP